MAFAVRFYSSDWIIEVPLLQLMTSLKHVILVVVPRFYETGNQIKLIHNNSSTRPLQKSISTQ